MIPPARILESAARAAQQFTGVAIAWHLLLLAALAALALGWRPSRRTAGLSLAAPLFSVSALAWAAGNPFNAIVFAAAGMLLVALALGLPPLPVQASPRWQVIAGAVAVLTGWAYPHFLAPGTRWLYLAAAPFGVVPCPTLLVVSGLSLAASGLGSRAWTIATGSLALFYGVFGALRLGVQLDVVLAAGAALLLLSQGAQNPSPASSLRTSS